MKKTLLTACLTAAAAVALTGSAFATTPLYFFNHNDLPASGAIASWNGAAAITSWQGDGVPAAGPTVEVINGQKWSKNYYVANVGAPWANEPGSSWGKWTGYRVAEPTAPIAINGATIVVAAKRGAVAEGAPWTSIVDVMYDKLVLGIRNDTGQIVVRRNGSVDVSTATIAVDQATVLSMTVQADGSYEVFADGLSVLSRGAAGTMTEWDPNRLQFKDEPDWAATGTPGGNWDAWWDAVMAAEPTVTARWDWNNLNALPNKDTYWGFTAPVEPFKKFINIGRNNPDGWTAFNGSIGDIKIFGTALSNEERLAEVASTSAAMGLGSVPEPASMLAMLSGLVGMAGFAVRRKRA